MTENEPEPAPGVAVEDEPEPAPAPVSFPRRFISVGIIVALLPAFGFFLAYLYEVGIARIYRIEPENIEISVATVAATATRYSVFVGLIITILGTTIFGERQAWFRSRPTMHVSLLIELALILALTYVFTRGFNMPNLLLTPIVVAMFVLIVVLVWMERWESKPHEPSAGRALARLIESGYFPIVAALVVLSFASYWKGLGDAERQERFLVSKADPSIVVLRQYGGRIVAARLIDDNVVDSSTRIYLRAGDVGAKEFEERKLGSLRFEP